jgi:hypothetical protein
MDIDLALNPSSKEMDVSADVQASDVEDSSEENRSRSPQSSANSSANLSFRGIATRRIAGRNSNIRLRYSGSGSSSAIGNEEDELVFEDYSHECNPTHLPSPAWQAPETGHSLLSPRHRSLTYLTPPERSISPSLATPHSRSSSVCMSTSSLSVSGYIPRMLSPKPGTRSPVSYSPSLPTPISMPRKRWHRSSSTDISLRHGHARTMKKLKWSALPLRPTSTLELADFILPDDPDEDSDGDYTASLKTTEDSSSNFSSTNDHEKSSGADLYRSSSDESGGNLDIVTRSGRRISRRRGNKITEVNSFWQAYARHDKSPHTSTHTTTESDCCPRSPSPIITRSGRRIGMRQRDSASSQDNSSVSNDSLTRSLSPRDPWFQRRMHRKQRVRSEFGNASSAGSDGAYRSVTPMTTRSGRRIGAHDGDTTESVGDPSIEDDDYSLISLPNIDHRSQKIANKRHRITPDNHAPLTLRRAYPALRLRGPSSQAKPYVLLPPLGTGQVQATMR